MASLSSNGSASTSTSSAKAPATHRPALRRAKSKAPSGAQVRSANAPHGAAAAARAAVPLTFPAHALPPAAVFQPRALLAPAKTPHELEAHGGAQPQPSAPLIASSAPMAGAALSPEAAAPAPPAIAPEPAASEAREPEASDSDAYEIDTAALMRELGMEEPDPGTPEALALLAEAGVAPRPGPGEALGPDDERFSPIAIGHLTHRLVEVKRSLEQLNAEQKALHETLRLAHLRGDLLHLLAPSTVGWCYQIGQGVLLNRQQGNKKWTDSDLWTELEAQLKARQTYEQATGEATWRHGAAFWEVRGQKGVRTA